MILRGLRVVTPDRSALLPNRRLLGLGDEEGVGRPLGCARGGVPSITICFYALLGHTGPCFECVAASRYVVDGLSLGGHVKWGNQASRPYQCGPSDKFSGLIWCHEEHTTPDNEVMRSHSILKSQDGTAYYINSYFQPAFFDPNDIQNEIDRMSSEFGQQARIVQMSQREGLAQLWRYGEQSNLSRSNPTRFQ